MTLREGMSRILWTQFSSLEKQDDGGRGVKKWSIMAWRHWRMTLNLKRNEHGNVIWKKKFCLIFNYFFCTQHLPPLRIFVGRNFFSYCVRASKLFQMVPIKKCKEERERKKIVSNRSNKRIICQSRQYQYAKKNAIGPTPGRLEGFLFSCSWWAVEVQKNGWNNF